LCIIRANEATGDQLQGAGFGNRAPQYKDWGAGAHSAQGPAAEASRGFGAKSKHVSALNSTAAVRIVWARRGAR
jgi:hypothetical protein